MIYSGEEYVYWSASKRKVSVNTAAREERRWFIYRSRYGGYISADESPEHYGKSASESCKISSRHLAEARTRLRRT